MVGLRKGDEIAINEASSAITAKLNAKTPQGETRRFNWIDIWNETFDRLHDIATTPELEMGHCKDC
jgi:hypothetical protein